MKAVLKYPGAKHRVAPWIMEHIPEHDVYVEPFFGSGAIFFQKKRSHIETINDINSEVVNFFKVVRDNGEELALLLYMTPFSREEYDNAYITNEYDSDIERARKFCVRCWQGFGCANLYHNGFKSGQQTNSPNPAKAFAELPYTILQAVERLRGVQIECLNALEVIKRYDTNDVFIYLDPPYVWNTRKKYLYKHEMTDEEHKELLEVCKQHPGKIMLSGYDNELYNQVLVGWNKVQKQTTAERGLKRVETLWMNYEIGQQRLMLSM